MEDAAGVGVCLDVEAVRRIVKSKSRGCHNRDDIMGEALLAFAQGSDRRGIETACRTALRREWRYAARHVTLDMDILRRTPDYGALWDAIKALSPRQYEAVVLHYWGGLTLAEAAARMGVTFQAVFGLLRHAQKNLKNFLGGVEKNGTPLPIVSEGKMRSGKTIVKSRKVAG